MLTLKKRLVVALIIILGAPAIVLGARIVSGDIIFEEAGWKITMPSWVESPTGGAVVVRDTSPGIPDDVLVLEIGKIFKGSLGQFNEMPSVVMMFEQITNDAPDKIVINDEAIVNNTTADWIDFHYILMGTEASFNRAETFPSATGGNPDWDFDIAPFKQYSWRKNPQAGTEQLSLFDGVVPQGHTFFPGSPEGSLVIDVDLSGPQFVSFMFKEIPSIPEPATLLLLMLGGAVLTVHRRRRSR